jgi:hypothetical protein
MNPRIRFLRFVSGLVLSLLVLVTGFSMIRANIPSWGADPAELSQTLPGDEILTHPSSAWVNSVTINAAPEAVWPWLIQMGDSRAGFYSFTFIERGFMRVFGYTSSDVKNYYVNADHIHEEWQNPPIQQGIIMDYVALRDYQPGRYVLASATPKFAGMGWTWLWYISPTADGRTRLIVHLRLQPPAPAQPNPLMDAVSGAVMDLGSFMMEKNMIDGIQLRAEGGSEPDWGQDVEIILWLGALAAGIAAAVLYLRKRTWQIALATGLLAIVALIVFTYIQPALWLRTAADLLLLGGVILAWKSD